jgi:hypothetical protein
MRPGLPAQGERVDGCDQENRSAEKPKRAAVVQPVATGQLERDVAEQAFDSLPEGVLAGDPQPSARRQLGEGDFPFLVAEPAFCEELSHRDQGARIALEGDPRKANGTLDVARSLDVDLIERSAGEPRQVEGCSCDCGRVEGGTREVGLEEVGPAEVTRS